MVNTCLFVAGMHISGGNNNFALEVGGVLFERMFSKGMTHMFMGSITGCLVAQAMFYKFFSSRKVNQEMETLAMLLKRGRRA
jgi:hypothetical protein